MIPVNFKLSAQVHTFQPRCRFSARLQSIRLAAVSQHCYTVSPPLQLCPELCQSSCSLSSQLQYVCSVMTCQLGSSLSAQSVSSAATWQFSCGISAQLSCYLKAQLQLVNSAVSSPATCQLSCKLSARLHPVTSDESCHLSCNKLAEL